ncbi:ArsR/SmtB family transcription factor [Sphingobium ummariense]
MAGQAFDDQAVEQMAEALRVLGHGTRLRLLHSLLGKGELAVGELETETGVGQPALSQQLAILRKAEMVQARRAAKQVYYSIDAARMAALAQGLAALAGLPSPAEASPDHPSPHGSAATFAKIL